MKSIKLLLLLCASAFSCADLTLPVDWLTVSGISRSNLQSNPNAIKTTVDCLNDSLSALQGAVTGTSGDLGLKSKQDLNLQLDSDANSTGHKFLLSHDGSSDTLFRVSDDSTARFFGAVTGTKWTGTDSLIGTVVKGTGANLSGLTASQAIFTDASKNLTSNAITGTGNVVMSADPTLTGTIAGENQTLSGTFAVTGTSAFSNAMAITGPSGAGEVVNMKGNTSSGGYLTIYDNVNTAARGYLGYGSTIIGSGAISDVGLRSQGALKFSTGGSTVRYEITSGGAHNFTGAAEFSTTLETTGLHTATGGIELSGGTGGEGRLFFSAVNGIKIRGKAGSSNDFAIQAVDGTDLLYNPTGTTIMAFQTPVTMAGKLTGSDSIVTSGSGRFDGNMNITGTARIDGSIASGATPAANYGFYMGADNNASGAQAGFYVENSFGGTGSYVSSFISNPGIATAKNYVWGVDIYDGWDDGGSVDTLIGLNVRNQAFGDSVNIAIKTGTGKVEFGDSVTVSGTLTADSLGTGNEKFVYDEGEFTVTLNGVSGSVTGTAYYARIGNSVDIRVPMLEGTSDSDSATITGFPADIMPTTSIDFFFTIMDNSTTGIDLGVLSPVGGLTLYNGSKKGFTSSGDKGLAGGGLYITMSYRR